MNSRTRSIIGCTVLVALLALGFLRIVSGDTPPDSENGQPLTLATEKVILVVVDGLRLQESYKYADYDHPTRPAMNYTQRLSREILPKGTLFTDARTGVFNTITTSCNNTIVTGAWNGGPNRGRGEEASGDDYVDNRTFDRTLFELAREELALPATKVAFISDKLNTRLSNHSYHPAGGADLSPNSVFYSPRFNSEEPVGEETWIDPSDNSDRDVLLTALDVMDTSAPDLLYLCFGNVDIAGHRAIMEDRNDFDFYTRSIEIWDDLISDFWNTVQSHPAYRDKTTLIICSDHGRHDDHDEASYGSHSGTCDGTRGLLLFAIGPDTPQGSTVGRRAYQSDIAPTIARLLGFPVPEATGQPLYEALSLAPGAETRRFVRNMRAAIDGDTVLTAYRTADIAGNRQLVFQRSRSGDTFDPPVVLAESPWNSDTFWDYPDISVDSAGIHVIAWQWTDRNHRYVYWTSTDGGETFSANPTPLANGKPELSSAGYLTLGRPRIYASDEEDTFLAPVVADSDAGNESLILRVTTDKFGGAPTKKIEDAIPEHRRFGHHNWIESARDADGDFLAAYSALTLPTNEDIEPLRATWEVFFKNFEDTGAGDPPVRLTDDNAVPVVMPTLAVDEGGTAHLVYARLVTGRFQLMVRQSVDDAKTRWTLPVQLTQSDKGAWEPAALHLDGRLHIVYTDYRTGDGDIHYLALENGEIVSGPSNLSSEGISRNPKILATEDSSMIHVIWEEQNPGSSTFTLARTSVGK